MIQKKLLAVGVGLALSAMTATTLANTLTLQSQNEPNSIAVACNNISGLPIPANGQLGPLSYISLYVLFQRKSTLNCTFSENGAQIGTATLQLGPKFQHAQILSDSVASGYSVTISPTSAISQPTSDITVTLTKHS